MGKGIGFSSWMQSSEKPQKIKHEVPGEVKPKKAKLIEFAPLRVPFERRMQTLAALLWISIFVVILPFAIPIMLYVILYTRWGFLPLMYIAWIYIDRNTCNTGGRYQLGARHWKIWRYFRDYFPIKLVKTAELDPKKNYLFGSHPHGILCSGAFACFGTEALEVSKVFPGITPHLLTLQMNFWIPFFRELGVSMGMCSVTKESINYLLSYPGGGKAAVLIPGGASESLESHPGSYVVHLRKRKGFVRLALQTGATLVPVFSFGETDIYDQFDNPDGSTLRRIQNKLQKTINFAPIFFNGRGVFNYSFGALPKRKPITTVVGAPLEAKHIPQPTKEDIDSVHEMYIEALTKLFYEHRNKCADPKAEITII